MVLSSRNIILLCFIRAEGKKDFLPLSAIRAPWRPPERPNGRAGFGATRHDEILNTNHTNKGELHE